MKKVIDSMIDRNGNTIKKGDTVDVVIAGEFQHKAIFRYASEQLATIQELGVKFQHGGLQGYSIQALKQYVYKSVQ